MSILSSAPITIIIC